MGVTAVMMDICSEDSSHVVTPMAPNVCKTPAAPSPLPIPYPILGDTSSLDPGCEKTVVGESKKTMNTKGKVKSIHGNEAGTLKDIITSTNIDHAFAMVGAPTVFFEGAMIAITGSTGFGNTK